MRKLVLLTTCAAFMGAISVTPTIAATKHMKSSAASMETSKSSNPLNAYDKMTKKKKKAKKTSSSGMKSGSTTGMNAGKPYGGAGDSATPGAGGPNAGSGTSSQSK